MRTVLIVLFDGVQSLDVTGPLEALAGARTEAGDPGYQVRTASLDGGPVRTSSGLRLTPDGALSDAQLESIIYAGEAHADFLAGSWTVDETFDLVTAARDDAENAVRFRRGWFLGDGTGAGYTGCGSSHAGQESVDVGGEFGVVLEQEAVRRVRIDLHLCLRDQSGE